MNKQNKTKEVSLKELYTNIGKHVDEPFYITDFNKKVAFCSPIDEDSVVLNKEKLEKLEEEGQVAFTYNGEIYVITQADVGVKFV